MKLQTITQQNQQPFVNKRDGQLLVKATVLLPACFWPGLQAQATARPYAEPVEQPSINVLDELAFQWFSKLSGLDKSCAAGARPQRRDIPAGVIDCQIMSKEKRYPCCSGAPQLLQALPLEAPNQPSLCGWGTAMRSPPSTQGPASRGTRAHYRTEAWPQCAALPTATRTSLACFVEPEADKPTADHLSLNPL